MTKKLAGVSLFIFWASVAAILTAGLVFYQNDKTSAPDTSVFNSGSSNSAQEKQTTLDANEIAKHESTQSCWLLINNKVYDVTTYLGLHPGGAAAITPYCGKEATSAFEGESSHRESADNTLASYYIGDLNQKIGNDKTGQNTQNTPTQPPETAVNPIASTPTVQPSPVSSQTNLNTTEVAKHNSTSDCWVIINSKVYNVTSYLPKHPGGIGAISPYCGKDATAAFSGLPHSSYASDFLASYYIGDLNQNISDSQVQQNTQNTNNTTPPAQGKKQDDDKYDDD